MSKKVNKITKKELEQVNGLISKSNQIAMQLGSLDVSKDGLIQEFKANQTLIEKFKTGLQETYGEISIDLNDGSFTEVEKVKEDEVESNNGK